MVKVLYYGPDYKLYWSFKCVSPTQVNPCYSFGIFIYLMGFSFRVCKESKSLVLLHMFPVPQEIIFSYFHSSCCLSVRSHTVQRNLLEALTTTAILLWVFLHGWLPRTHYFESFLLRKLDPFLEMPFYACFGDLGPQMCCLLLSFPPVHLVFSINLFLFSSLDRPLSDVSVLL